MEQRPHALDAAIVALEKQRAVLGDTVVDAALAALRAQRVATTPDAPPELKQVTMLFVDAVGSTAAGERLDPEAVHAVFGAALERFTESVARFRGKVVKYTGDGLLAVFGSGASQEDDVESAILAALAILDEARRWAVDARRSHGVADFDVRAGIHTGMALLGTVGGKGDLAGAAVNVAARMEQSAPRGRLRISHDSFRHVRGHFDVEEQVPLALKGVEQPLRSYLVVRARPRSQRRFRRGVEGVQAPVVGRDAELAALLKAVDTAMRERRARAVTVIAEAGMGKSRLLDEFRHRAHVDVVIMQATHRGIAEPYAVLRDLVALELGIVETDPDDVARAKLAGLEASGDGSLAPVLGQLVGLDFSDDAVVSEMLADEARFRDRAFAAVTQWLLRRTERGALVVTMDDAHWADDASLDFLDHFVRACADRAVVVATFARPELLERRPTWADASNGSTLSLAPLDERSSGALAISLLERLGEAVPAELGALLVRYAEGSPFAMEELIGLLIDDGVIHEGPDGWTVDRTRLVVQRLPTTLAGILQARLDALTPEQRRALQMAGIVGPVFWDVVLASIGADALAALPALERKRFVIRHETSSLDGAVEYAFQHNLLQQAAYDTTLRASKASGHARASAFWQERADPADYASVTAANLHALREASYHGLRSDAASWIDWFEQRFTVYLGSIRTRELQPMADQVVAACERIHGADHPQTARALTNVARLMVQARRGDAAKPLLRALDIQRRELPADHLDTARTLAVIGGWHAAKGEHEEAIAYLRQALAIREARLGPDAPLTLGLIDVLAKSLLEVENIDEAELLLRRVHDTYVRTEGAEHPKTAFACVMLGDALTRRGDAVGAEALFRQALEVQERILPAGHFEIGLTLWHLANALRLLGRLADAETQAQRALELWEAHWGPDHEWPAWASLSLAEIRLAQERFAEAEALAARATDTFDQLSAADPLAIAQALDVHARAMLALGRNGEAAASAERALELRAAGLPTGHPMVEATRKLVEESTRS